MVFIIGLQQWKYQLKFQRGTLTIHISVCSCYCDVFWPTGLEVHFHRKHCVSVSTDD